MLTAIAILSVMIVLVYLLVISWGVTAQDDRQLRREHDLCECGCRRDECGCEMGDAEAQAQAEWLCNGCRDARDEAALCGNMAKPCECHHDVMNALTDESQAQVQSWGIANRPKYSGQERRRVPQSGPPVWDEPSRDKKKFDPKLMAGDVTHRFLESADALPEDE